MKISVNILSTLIVYMTAAGCLREYAGSLRLPAHKTDGTIRIMDKDGSEPDALTVQVIDAFHPIQHCGIRRCSTKTSSVAGSCINCP